MRDEQVQMFLFGVREICYYAAAPHSKNLKKKEIFELKIDRELRKRRLKGMKPMEVTIDGKKQ